VGVRGAADGFRRGEIAGCALRVRRSAGNDGRCLVRSCESGGLGRARLCGVSVDFYGSIGYGQAFTDSINNDWGGKPLTDLELGLQAAIQRFSFLNAEDVCDFGGSYGGYMMNWIEGHWPHRFRCLIQDDGIFDVRAMAYETDELWADRWDHGGKLYFQAPAAYEKWNPADAVAAWSTPQLVITGEKDVRSPSTQAVAAFTALQLPGVPSRLLVFPDEDHWVQHPADRLRWYGEVFRWMDQDPAAVDAAANRRRGELAPRVGTIRGVDLYLQRI